MEVHERFYEAVSTQSSLVSIWSGAKCSQVDSVCPQTAIKVWRWFGAPSSICDLLADFYMNSVVGLLGKVLITLIRFLLNGVCCNCCPASPALLNALMTVWVIKRQEPRISLAIAPCGNKVVKVLKWSSTP